MEREEEFHTRLQSPVPLPDGIGELLESLRGRYRLAIVSSAPRTQFDAIHRHSGLLPFFEKVITADDCKAPKPSPECYLAMMDWMGLRPEQCLAVEDSPVRTRTTGRSVPAGRARTRPAGASPRSA